MLRVTLLSFVKSTEHRVPVVELPVLVFYGKNASPAIATLIRSVSNFSNTIGLLEVFCRDLALAVLILFLLEQSKRY